MIGRTGIRTRFLRSCRFYFRQISGSSARPRETTDLGSFVLQTREQPVKHLIPILKCLGKVPQRCSACDDGLSGAEGVQRGYKRCQKRPEKLNEECLECIEQIFDVCELQDALVGDLWRSASRRRTVGPRHCVHTTKMSSRSLTNVHLTAYPSFSYFSSVVRPSIRASRMSEFTGDAVDVARFAASGVNERDQRTIPPRHLRVSVVPLRGLHGNPDLCEIWSSGQA